LLKKAGCQTPAFCIFQPLISLIDPGGKNVRRGFARMIADQKNKWCAAIGKLLLPRQPRGISDQRLQSQLSINYLLLLFLIRDHPRNPR
jgi:hypothetical protein